MKFKMKKTLVNIFLLMGALAGLSSCNDELAEPPITIPAAGIGTGTWDNPLTAGQARLGSVNYQVNPAWVKGYIVGVIDVDKSTVLNENSADFMAPFTVETNMLIADDYRPFERLAKLYEEGDEDAYTALRDSLIEVVAPVQLPSGMRPALNPMQNPDALHAQVCIQGTTGNTYCGEYGVRDLLAYNFGETGKEPSETPEPMPVGKFYQNFTAATTMDALEMAGWRNDPTEGNLYGWKVVITDDNNYIATDAFLGFADGGPYEHWLVTPPITLDELPEKTLEFESAAANPADGTTIEVFAMRGNDPLTAVLTPLEANFATAPASGYSEWVSSGKISLEGFSGEICIGLRYRAERGGYGNSVTYCLDNINVGNMAPPADWTKAHEFYTALSKTDSDGAAGWTFDNVLLTGGMSYVWKWTEYNGSCYLNASAFYSSRNNPALAYAYSDTVDLTDYKNVGLSFEHAAKFQTTLPQLGRVVVREAGTEDWTEYVIPAWPAAGNCSFATSGIIDISDFAGKKVELGFKYESTEDGADQWEIQNLRLIGIEK